MNLHAATDPGPAHALAPSERVASLDVLRGLALFGVLAINLENEFRVSIFEQFLLPPPVRGPDHWVAGFLHVFLDLKAFAVFALLFGIGLAIQHERLQRNPRRTTLLLRRLLVLLAFGLAHMLLIWNGDILAEYAIAGLVALPFLYAPTRLLALGATGCLLLFLAMPFLPPVIALPDAGTLANHVRLAERIYGAGGFGDILAFRIEETALIVPLHVLMFPRTAGLFLLGMLAWRLRLVSDAAYRMRGLVMGGMLAAAAGIALTLASGGRPWSGWPGLGAFAPIASPLGTILLALGYASLVIALTAAGRGQWLAWAAPVGRMAFTNYIAQSVILGLIFYGYGLGLFGRMGLTGGLGLVLAIYASQMLVSRWWLARFRYGPLEWLWRRLMYGHPLPFRRPAATTNAG